jgi:hypothetical protein
MVRQTSRLSVVKVTVCPIRPHRASRYSGSSMRWMLVPAPVLTTGQAKRKPGSVEIEFGVVPDEDYGCHLVTDQSRK